MFAFCLLSVCFRLRMLLFAFYCFLSVFLCALCFCVYTFYLLFVSVRLFFFPLLLISLLFSSLYLFFSFSNTFLVFSFLLFPFLASFLIYYPCILLQLNFFYQTLTGRYKTCCSILHACPRSRTLSAPMNRNTWWPYTVMGGDSSTIERLVGWLVGLLR